MKSMIAAIALLIFALGCVDPGNLRDYADFIEQRNAEKGAAAEAAYNREFGHLLNEDEFGIGVTPLNGNLVDLSHLDIGGGGGTPDDGGAPPNGERSLPDFPETPESPSPEAEPLDTPQDLGVLTAENREGSISYTKDTDAGGQVVYTLTIKEGYTAIGERAFYEASPADFGVAEEVDNPSFKLIIPDGVTRIGDSAFELAGSIIAIEFPNTLEYIGARAFRQSGFKEEGLVIPNSVTEIGEAAFDAAGVENLVLGSGVRTIGDSAFQYHELPADFTVPANVVYIGKNAFAAQPGYENYDERTQEWVTGFTLKADNALPDGYEPRYAYRWDSKSSPKGWQRVDSQ